MEIIEQLEPQRRGIYCGSIGYIGFDGNMDCNIAIRTLVYADGEIRCWAGGGIVADSEAGQSIRKHWTRQRLCWSCCVAMVACILNNELKEYSNDYLTKSIRARSRRSRLLKSWHSFSFADYYDPNIRNFPACASLMTTLSKPDRALVPMDIATWKS